MFIAKVYTSIIESRRDGMSIENGNILYIESRRDEMFIAKVHTPIIESRRDGMSIENGSINRMSPVGTECL